MTQTRDAETQFLTNLRCNLEWARDEALLARFADGDIHSYLKRCRSYLNHALNDLNAIENPPDSGRASIPETEPEVGEQV